MGKLSILIISILLYSCSAQYHLNKAIKKGYVCEDTLQMDTIRIATIDSVPVIVNNEIIYEKFITQKDTIVKWKTKNVWSISSFLVLKNKNKFIPPCLSLQKRFNIFCCCCFRGTITIF